MRFVPDGHSASPTSEWLARVTPFLTADDPHQRCVAKARELNVNDVHQVCECPAPPPCTKSCCAPLQEEW